MYEYLTLVGKCVIIYFLIIVCLRVMGKREVGELSVLDIVIYFVMSELLAISIESDESIMKVIVPVVTLSLLQIAIAWVLLKLKKLRDVMEGVPVLIIENGCIDQNAMRKQRYTIDDLMYQLRSQSVSTPDEVQFAILENSGTLTVIKKTDGKTKWFEPLIQDGIIQQKVLDRIKKDEQWLLSQLKSEGVDRAEDVFLCMLQKNGLFVVKKNFDDIESV